MKEAKIKRRPRGSKREGVMKRWKRTNYRYRRVKKLGRLPI